LTYSARLISADLDLTHPPAYRLFWGISPWEVPPSARRGDREATRGAVWAAPVDSGHRQEVGHLAEHRPEVPADTRAAGGQATAAAAVQGGSVPRHVRRRLAAGVENCVVLLRELRTQGYAGSYSILKEHVRPLRLGRAVKATMRFETKPGEQAQVDFGHFPFLTSDGQRHWYWGFVMVLAWSRLLYVEFIRRADV